MDDYADYTDTYKGIETEYEFLNYSDVDIKSLVDHTIYDTNITENTDILPPSMRSDDLNESEFYVLPGYTINNPTPAKLDVANNLISIMLDFLDQCFIFIGNRIDVENAFRHLDGSVEDFYDNLRMC